MAYGPRNSPPSAAFERPPRSGARPVRREGLLRPAVVVAGSERSRSRTVPFEQIGQSAVKRLWRQKSELIARA